MRVPRIRGFDTRSRPPVEEMTSTLPVVQSPLGSRSTAGVYSVARTRGARPASDGGEIVICLRQYRTSPLLHRRLRKGMQRRGYPPVGPAALLGNRKEGSRSKFASYACPGRFCVNHPPARFATTTSRPSRDSTSLAACAQKRSARRDTHYASRCAPCPKPKPPVSCRLPFRRAFPVRSSPGRAA